jgi:DNA-binding MarR family transcriptional regulator
MKRECNYLDNSFHGNQYSNMETINASNRGISELEDHLGYWLRRVSNAVSGGFARALQVKQTSVAEWVILRVISGRGQATPGELAEIVRMTRGAVSKVVDKLEEKKWVKAQTKREDQRVRILTLTRKGRFNLPGLAQAADENDEHFFTCLDRNERATLQRLLVKLADLNQIRDVPTE